VEPYRTPYGVSGANGTVATTVLGPAWTDVGDRTRAGPNEPRAAVLGTLRPLRAELGGAVTGPALLVRLTPMVHHSVLVGG
jgi:hypothetical protein